MPFIRGAYALLECNTFRPGGTCLSRRAIKSGQYFPSCQSDHIDALINWNPSKVEIYGEITGQETAPAEIRKAHGSNAGDEELCGAV